MKVKDLLNEMSNIVISGHAQPEIRVYCRTWDSVGGQHWKSVKVDGPNDTYGNVPWDSDKPVEGNLDGNTKKIVINFIEVHRFLLDALWDKVIDYRQFVKMYRQSKNVGLDQIAREVARLRQTRSRTVKGNNT